MKKRAFLPFIGVNQVVVEKEQAPSNEGEGPKNFAFSLHPKFWFGLLNMGWGYKGWKGSYSMNIPK
jgi:hypothetical protein